MYGETVEINQDAKDIIADKIEDAKNNVGEIKIDGTKLKALENYLKKQEEALEVAKIYNNKARIARIEYKMQALEVAIKEEKENMEKAREEAIKANEIAMQIEKKEAQKARI